MGNNLRDAYMEEAVELLDSLEHSLLELENESNSDNGDLIAKVFRALHTFKGSSGMFGFDDIALFIHDIESVYDLIRKGEIKITQEIIGFTFSARDRIREMLFGQDMNISFDVSSTKEILISFKNIISEYNSKKNNANPSSEQKPIKKITHEDFGNYDSTYHIQVKPYSSFLLNGTNPINLLNELRGMGQSKIIGNMHVLPSIDKIEPTECFLFWDVILTTRESIDVVRDVFVFIDEDICSINIKLIDRDGFLNNVIAHNLLGELLSVQSELSKKDISNVIQKIKNLNPASYRENFSDYKQIEKLKEHFRDNGILGLIEKIKILISEINGFMLQLEGDSANQSIMKSITLQLDTLMEISDYFDSQHLTKTALGLKTVITCFINRPTNISSEIIEVCLEGIDHLFEILENILSNSSNESNTELEISFNKIISKHFVCDNEDHVEFDEDADVLDSAILKDFLSSATEMLESLEQNTLLYEKTDSEIHLNEIFRIVHTIKGDSMVTRLNKLVSYSDILENLLQKLRSGQIKRTVTIIDIILKASGTIKTVVEELNKGNSNSLTNYDIQLLRDQILIHGGIESISNTMISSGVKSTSNTKTTAFLNQISQYKEMILISIKDWSVTHNNTELLERSLNNLENAARYMKHLELLRHVNNSQKIIKNGQSEEIFKSMNSIVDYICALIDGKVPIEFGEIKSNGSLGLSSGISNPNNNINTGMDSDKSDNSNETTKVIVEVENKTMKVDESKIDKFSNMIGELVIARNSYEYLLNEVYSQTTIEQSIEKKLNDNLHLFSRLTNDLQVGVMTLRMVPLKNLFQKYTRVIRDISKKQNKEIELVTFGSETEVDKKIVDSLSDPLIHLIRNSCDHGIELPEERIKLGKNKIGTIQLKASIEGGKLIVVINDDGKGLDRKRIFEKAQKMGIDTKCYDDNTIFDLIFAPGFSTKSEVSELSGRGVGMDVVKTTIDKLGGSINIKTEENIGTEITFTIPMSIGLSDSLLVQTKGETYALPVQSVVKTLKLYPNQIFRLHDRLGINHRGDVIPTATLLELLTGKSEELGEQLNSYKENIFNNNNDEIPIVIVQTKQGNYGLIVDKLLKNIELSIKPVPECLAKSNVISGVSILGDGNVVLVLNPEKLV